MDVILEILKYILPALIVFVTTFYLVKKYFDNENLKRKHDFRLKNQEQIIPLRIQAYERLVLFLERISIDNLIMRVSRSDYTVKKLQTELISAIRQEYEHNLTQQLYISHEAWELIRMAKENTIKTINLFAGELEDNSPGMQLNKALLENVIEENESNTSKAQNLLKKELGDIYF
ncbi:MAG: hypothetical protein JXJ22_05140 [Bacteroidales bacterium]|nr:hypothetical protein [Bacteroidales bacterium]